MTYPGSRCGTLLGDMEETATTTTPASPRVGPGLIATIEWMGSDAFREIVELFDADTRIGGAYFRPTDTGVQPVDLHSMVSKPMIAIGGRIPAESSVETVAASMEGRVEALLGKRDTSKRSLEKQLEARLVRRAQATQLRLDDVAQDLKFLASQWRIDLAGRGTPIDLLGVDADTGALMVIELKMKLDPKDPPMVRARVEEFRNSADAYSAVFTRLAHVLGGLYGNEAMQSLEVDASATTGVVAWPESGTLRVRPC